MKAAQDQRKSVSVKIRKTSQMMYVEATPRKCFFHGKA